MNALFICFVGKQSGVMQKHLTNIILTDFHVERAFSAESHLKVNISNSCIAL